MSKREIKALEAHWSRALDIAVHAIEAGKEAEMLPEAFCELELRHIRQERYWLAEMQWP